jgi:hypothetical protein
MPHTTKRHRRLPGPWLTPGLLAAACVLTACTSNGSSPADDAAATSEGSTPPSADPRPGDSEGDPPTAPAQITTRPAGDTTASSSAAAQPTTAVPHRSAEGSPPLPPGCLTGSATVALQSGTSAAHNLCALVGAVITVILPPAANGPWPPARSDRPMLATVTSACTDPDGTYRTTIRATRPGAATITWATDSTTAFTLHLAVVGRRMT